MRTFAVTMLIAGLVCAVAAAGAPADQTVWLCRPGMSADPCHGSLRTTDLATGAVTDPALPAHPRIDCFYVYPTVSNQVGPNATKTAEAEEKAIALYQAARFSQQCRVYAPVYRQLTLLSIFDGGFTDASRKIAYDDVLAAFRDYLAHDNRGRGFVLIGHSQGSGVLRKLIHDEIDPSAKLRRRMVSALLLGGNVTVKAGKDRGGDFRHVRLCTRDGQIGCVVAYSTFEDDPPGNTRFGKIQPGPDRLTGLAPRPGLEVACTNPASLRADAEAPMQTYLPSQLFPPGLILVGIIGVYGGPPPSAPTPWLRPADRYTGRCVHVNGAHVLKINPVGGARHLRASPDATWGLHLVDVNGALGNLQSIVATQTRVYLKRYRARARR